MREKQAGERRVGVAPQSIPKLAKLGLEVVVERGAGEASGYPDQAYLEAGAILVSALDGSAHRDGPSGAWDADVVVKVQPPTMEEAARLHEGAVLVSLIHPAR